MYPKSWKCVRIADDSTSSINDKRSENVGLNIFSGNISLRVLRMIDEPWGMNGIGSGLSSGEGLIWQVRDPVEQQTPVKEKGRVVGYEMVTTDPGVSDKRLLVIEEEFVRVLASIRRRLETSEIERR